MVVDCCCSDRIECEKCPKHSIHKGEVGYIHDHLGLCRVHSNEQYVAWVNKMKEVKNDE